MTILSLGVVILPVIGALMRLSACKKPLSMLQKPWLWLKTRLLCQARAPQQSTTIASSPKPTVPGNVSTTMGLQHAVSLYSFWMQATPMEQEHLEDVTEPQHEFPLTYATEPQHEFLLTLHAHVA